MAQDSAADPFVRPSPSREGMVNAVAFAALLWGCGYLGWRVLATMTDAHAVSGSVLFSAEVLATVVFALRVRSARSTPVTAIDAPDAILPELTVVVDASGVSLDELRTTLISLARLEGEHIVTIVDAEESRSLRSMASRFDAAVMGPTVSVERAIATAPTEWVLRLRAGDIPLPDLVSMCAPVCAAPDVGVVQVGVEEADPTSYEHDPDGRWSLAPYEHQVVRPSMAGRGSIPWFGHEPVLIRTEAFLASADDLDLSVSDVDRGIEVQRAGFHVTCVPITLARVRGPRSLGESLARRQTRLRRQVGVVLDRSIRSLARQARWSHRVALIGPLSAIQRILLVAAATLVLAFAQTPLDAAPIDLIVAAGPAYALRWTTQLLLGRGRLVPFSILRSDLRTIGVDLTLFRRKRGHHSGDLRLLVLMTLTLGAAVIVTTLSVWRDWTDRLTAETAAVSLALTVGFLGVAMEVLLDAVARRQHRQNHRIRLGLVTCLFQEMEGVLVDLSLGGAGIALPCLPDAVPEVGTVTTVAFRIPDASGAWRNVATLAEIIYVNPGLPGETKVGIAFDDPTDAPLDPVIEFLTIDRRLVTLGRRKMAAG